MCYTIRVSDRTILSPIVCVCYHRSSSFVCCCSFFASWFPYIPQYCPTFYVLLFFAPTSLHSPSAPIIQMYQWVLNSLLPPSPPWPRSIHHYHTLLFETSLSLILSQLFLPSIAPPYTLLSSRNNFYGLTWHSKVTYSSSPTCPSSFESKRRGWNVLFFFT